MDFMDVGGDLRAMDSFDFYCLLQGWGGLEYHSTHLRFVPHCGIIFISH